MDNEHSFFRTLRQSLGLFPDGERPKALFPSLFARADSTSILREISNRSTMEQEALVDILQTNAQALGITTYIVRNHDEAAAIIVDLVRTKDPEFTPTKHLIHHDHPDLAALQLWKRFNREGITVHTSFGPDRQVREKTLASFIGVSAPDIAVADSATLVQITEPGRPRSTSLVPSIHIALLQRENLVADLREAYALLQQRSRLESFVFITGPSKTADIEAQMVHGAHGPRAVHLIILCPPSAADHGGEQQQPAEDTREQ
jgi:L-lactate dehydrogenase complex protein LldG